MSRGSSQDISMETFEMYTKDPDAEDLVVMPHVWISIGKDATAQTYLETHEHLTTEPYCPHSSPIHSMCSTASSSTAQIPTIVIASTNKMIQISQSSSEDEPEEKSNEEEAELLEGKWSCDSRPPRKNYYYSPSMEDQTNAKEFERIMVKVIDKECLEKIKEVIPAKKLDMYQTNILEKSIEVSSVLRELAQRDGPDAEDFQSLSNKVEQFAVELLDPLKSDDMMRSIFEGEDFDRVVEKAVVHQQKKFVSHPVVYDLLMRRWAGPFHHLTSSSWNDLKTLQWLLIHLWTLLDLVLFPLVFAILYLVHLIIGLVKRRQAYHIVLLSNATWKNDNINEMEELSGKVMKDGSGNPCIEYAFIRCDKSQLESCDFQRSKTIWTRNIFTESLEIAKMMFKRLNDHKGNKILVVMTDDTVGQPLAREMRCIKNMAVHVIVVGFGVHPDAKELFAMATSKTDVILYQGNAILDDISKKVIEKIHGYDIFDRYHEYFVTPYFIFVRDTLSYLVLLALHFAMCLQPSTLHITTMEWVILCFFIGRVMIEIYEAIMNTGKGCNNQRNRTFTENNEKMERGKCPLKNTLSSKQSDGEMDGNQNRISQRRARKTATERFCSVLFRYFSDWWNVLDVVTLLIFLVIIILRFITMASHLVVSKNRLLVVAGYLYGLNTIFLTLRVFGHIMESTAKTGSIQIALFQIMSAVVAIFGQFIAVILAFSLAITKVYVSEISYNPATNSSLHGFCTNSEGGLACWLESASHLTWSLLGDTNAEPMKSLDQTSDVLAKLLYALFLVMAVVMIMNMMIALLSNTYQKVQDNAFYEWSYRKATTINTYRNYHPVPVPFNIISFAAICIWRGFKFLRSRRKRESATLDTASKRKYFCNYGHSFFDCLVFDLQHEYFAARGNTLPMTDSNKIDSMLKECKGNRQMIGQIANRNFKYSKTEARELLKDLENPLDLWESRGIGIKGHQLTYIHCQCSKCGQINKPTKIHGALFRKNLSAKWPGFEVLIEESGKRRFIAIGVVTEEYDCHYYPGLEGNSAGYHIDDGKIFDSRTRPAGSECQDALADRGDLIGCKISYDHLSRDNTLSVSFTLNGRVIGVGSVRDETGTTTFYPFVAMGWEGISVLFKMCSSDKNQLFFEEDYSDQMLDKIHNELCHLRLSYTSLEQIVLSGRQTVSLKLENLERKIGELQRSKTSP